MGHHNRDRLASLMLLCSLLFAMFGWSMIFRHQKENLQATRFTKMDDYILARWNLDTELSELEWQMYHLDASVKGTILLVFDQCAPNAYDIVYPQLAEFGMVGSVTFRDTLPGDAGAMTREQWLELESKGWVAAIASPDELLADKNSPDYPTRLASYAEGMKQKCTSRGFTIPTAYTFSEGEYSKANAEALKAIGFRTFTAPDAETEVFSDGTVLFKELYLSSGPNAPLIKGDLENIKNQPKAVTIKTRYVYDIEDFSKDTEITKFRRAMLTTIAGYVNAGSIRMESLDSAFAALTSENERANEVEKQKEILTQKIEAAKQEIDGLWAQYRGN